MGFIELSLLLLVTCFIGTYFENKHYADLKQREIALIKKPVINYGAKRFKPTRKVKNISFVSGEAVIGADFFKYYVSKIKSLFGGRLTTVESILNRARREAILRMKEKACSANIIVNVKIETIMINDTETRTNSLPKCAVIAYGTAVTYE